MTIRSNGLSTNSECWAPVGDSYILTVGKYHQHPGLHSHLLDECLLHIGLAIIFPTIYSSMYVCLSLAVCNFNVDKSVLYGLKLTVGDLIVTYERLGDWYRGCLLRDRTEIGIFPVSFVVTKELEVHHVGYVCLMIIFNYSLPLIVAHRFAAMKKSSNPKNLLSPKR